MRSRRLPFAFLLAAAVAGGATAQCTVRGVAVQAYGSGCNPVFSTLPIVGAVFDASRCALDVTVQGFAGCCNTYLTAHLLALGTGPVHVPLPQLGSGCTLLASPDAVLVQPASLGGVFSFAVPPIAVPFTFAVQGGALYFTTIGFGNDLALTDGALITLS